MRNSGEVRANHNHTVGQPYPLQTIVGVQLMTRYTWPCCSGILYKVTLVYAAVHVVTYCHVSHVYKVPEKNGHVYLFTLYKKNIPFTYYDKTYENKLYIFFHWFTFLQYSFSIKRNCCKWNSKLSKPNYFN